jgi:hypothetical protein
MPVFKIHRLRDSAQEHFRWAAHTSGATEVRPKDYHEAGQVEAPNVYSAWTSLREADTPLRVGDVLELDSGELRICKYVGFEEARWVQPEQVPAPEGSPPVSDCPLPGAPI